MPLLLSFVCYDMLYYALLGLVSLKLAWLEFGRLSLLDLLGLAWQARSLESLDFQLALLGFLFDCFALLSFAC